MGWNRIRCNEVNRVQDEIVTFNVVTNGSLSKINFKKTAEVISGYILQPMSLFYHLRKLIFDERGDRMTGFGRQLSQKIESIRELGYEIKRDGGRKMKNISELAKLAARLYGSKWRERWRMSGNDRTWMLRNSLEAIEKAKVSVTSGDSRDLSDYKEFAAGIILVTLQRDSDLKRLQDDKVIDAFVDQLIKLLKEDFGGKLPSGTMKSYLIDAFEFEFLRDETGVK